MKNLIAQFASVPKKLFLFDGIGAMLSWAILFLILIPNHQMIGIPAAALKFLATFPILFAAFDAIVSYLRPKSFKPFINIVIALNVGYCALTLSHILMFSSTISWIGAVYFVSEILIILLLVRIELKVLKKLP